MSDIEAAAERRKQKPLFACDHIHSSNKQIYIYNISLSSCTGAALFSPSIACSQDWYGSVKRVANVSTTLKTATPGPQLGQSLYTFRVGVKPVVHTASDYIPADLADDMELFASQVPRSEKIAYLVTYWYTARRSACTVQVNVRKLANVSLSLCCLKRRACSSISIRISSNMRRA